MVDNTTLESTSTTHDSKDSKKCKSPTIVPGNTDNEMVDNIIKESMAVSAPTNKIEVRGQKQH